MFPTELHHFTFLLTVSRCSIPHQYLLCDFCCCFDNIHPDRWEVVSRCGLSLPFPDEERG